MPPGIGSKRGFTGRPAALYYQRRIQAYRNPGTDNYSSQQQRNRKAAFKINEHLQGRINLLLRENNR